MTGLREIQERFAGHLFDAGATEILQSVKSGDFQPDLRLQVYRNNLFAGFSDALGAIYPVVEKLVGEGFFLYACHEFIGRTPSRSGDLHDYGREFGAFLGSFEPARNLPYLPDVAQLEWLFHEAYHEAQSTGMDLESLGRVPPEDYERLVFKLNPAVRLMRSKYPVVDIWRVNQDDYTGEQRVDLDSGGVHLLMLRSGEEVEMHPLDAIDFEVLLNISGGAPLGDCVAAIQERDPGFDPGGFLSRFVRNHTLIDFSVL